MNIVRKCVAWNTARYDQILDLNLAVNLLTEETEELNDAGANQPVLVLDAIGDITFVAIGVLWKAGMPIESIEEILGIVDGQEHLHKIDACTLYTALPFTLASVSEFSDEWEKFAAMNAAVFAIYGVVIPRLLAMGMIEEFYNIVDAICNSNDTKVIKGKTDPSIKANIDKGNSFVPPTMALQRILSKYTTLPASIILN